MTGDKVDYVASQNVGDGFPEIPREQFNHSVIFIQPDGSASFGAKAVFQLWRFRPTKKFYAWIFEHVPGFAAISQGVYSLIASNRQVASGVTRVLWGNDVQPPTYFAARRWFLRTLGLIFLIAFVSL